MNQFIASALIERCKGVQIAVDKRSQCHGYVSKSALRNRRGRAALSRLSPLGRQGGLSTSRGYSCIGGSERSQNAKWEVVVGRRRRSCRSKQAES